MLKVLSYILSDLDPKVKVIGQKAGICDGVPLTSALVGFINGKNIIVNLHYFKLMLIDNNYVTYGHQIEMYGHDHPMNIKKENEWLLKSVSFKDEILRFFIFFAISFYVSDFTYLLRTRFIFHNVQ